MTESNSENWKQSAAFLEQLESLPSTLRPRFRQLVAEYRYFALIHHRHPFVSYRVLAELIRAGWKPNNAPMNPKEQQDG